MKKDKKLDSLKITKPKQLNIFEYLDTKDSKYSNTIELYDVLPKYDWGKQREYKDLSNATVKRQCQLRGTTFHVVVKPAIISKKGGNVLIYPSAREELVEDALRKLAVNGNGLFIDGNAGVLFTLYELQAELKKRGHTLSLSEIKEAIEVCRYSSLDCTSEDGESYISSSFFPMIGLTTRSDYKNKKGIAKCYVQFNPLVTESILNLTFRQYNYQIGMEIKSPLARYIYKRMSHYWLQASKKDPYTPSLVSYLRQSPRGLSKRMSENSRAMRNSLDILISHNVIDSYEESLIKEGRKLKDIRFTIWPHEKFISQLMDAHQTKSTKNALLQQKKEAIDA